MHFFEVGVAVKGGVAAEEEVSYYAYGPYVSTRKRARERERLVSPLLPFLAEEWDEGVGGGLHRFPVASLLEDFRGHVTRRAAGGGKYVKGLIIHYSRQAKISNQEIGVVFWRAEKEILGFQVTMNYAVVVEIGYSRQSGAYEVCSVGLVIASLATYSIKELSTKG